MIDLWSFSLDCDADLRRHAERLLSDEELRRAARFRFERHRRRFVTRRAMRRLLIALRLDIAVGDIAFEDDEFGRPLVVHAPPDFYFNTSHSGEQAVVVIANGPIGVDVESKTRQLDYLDFARRKFTVDEQRDLEGQPNETLSTAFFNCWTAKEAYIKALGCGLRKDLRSFSVYCDPGTNPGLRWERESDVAPGPWSFIRRSDGDYIVTIVAASDEVRPLLRVNPLSLESLSARRLVEARKESACVES